MSASAADNTQAPVAASSSSAWNRDAGRAKTLREIQEEEELEAILLSVALEDAAVGVGVAKLHTDSLRCLFFQLLYWEEA